MRDFLSTRGCVIFQCLERKTELMISNFKVMLNFPFAETISAVPSKANTDELRNLCFSPGFLHSVQKVVNVPVLALMGAAAALTKTTLGVGFF